MLSFTKYHQPNLSALYRRKYWEPWHEQARIAAFVALCNGADAAAAQAEAEPYCPEDNSGDNFLAGLRAGIEITHEAREEAAAR